MAYEYKLVLRNTPVGAEETPWLDDHRKRFTRAAKEVAKEMEGTKLHGTNKILRMNALIAAKLKDPKFQ